MAKTLAQLRTLTRALISEPSANYWSDSELNTWIQDGLNQFCDLTDVLDDISTDSSVQYQADYSIPTDLLKLKKIEFVRSNSVYDVTPASVYEMYKGITRNSMSYPYRFNFWGDYLRFDERPSSAAASTTLSAAISSTSDTSISITSVSGFPREGRLFVDGEVIEYWNISSTTLSPCKRGMEGTTAATHLNGATAILRDIWVYHTKRDVTLASDLTAVTIPLQFDPAPAHYAAYIARQKSKDYDLANEQKAVFNAFVQRGIDYAKLKVKRSYTPK